MFWLKATQAIHSFLPMQNILCCIPYAAYALLNEASYLTFAIQKFWNIRRFLDYEMNISVIYKNDNIRFHLKSYKNDLTQNYEN